MIDEISPCMIDLPNGHTLNNLLGNKDYKPHNPFKPTLISHEVPLGMLERSRAFNDYDYALVHLFKDHPDYFNFFVQSVAEGRRVILDNSLYELGEAFDIKEYAQWIDRLQPTYYILPDTFWDTDRTIEQAMEWMSKYGRILPSYIKKIGVAQGATYADIKRAYRFMSSFCDCIAFTFKFAPSMLTDEELNLQEFLDRLHIRYPRVEISGEDLTIEDKQAACRYLILKKLDEEGVIDYKKEHHLLGLQNTTLLYESCIFPWVTSIDTSNPIICGFGGNVYYFNETIIDDDCGRHISKHAFLGNSGYPKPKEQLKDYFYMNPQDPVWSQHIEDIMHNIRSFRDIVNPPELSALFFGNVIMR